MSVGEGVTKVSIVDRFVSETQVPCGVASPSCWGKQLGDCVGINRSLLCYLCSCNGATEVTAADEVVNARQDGAAERAMASPLSPHNSALILSTRGRETG